MLRFSPRGQGLAGLILAQVALFYSFQKDCGGIAFLLALAALICLYSAYQSLRRKTALNAVYYRAGDALEKAHLYRKLLDQFLSLCSQDQAVPLRLSQFEHSPEGEQVRILERLHARLPNFTDERAIKSPRAFALQSVDNLRFCNALAKDYFVRHQSRLRSAEGQSHMTQSLFDQHMDLRLDIRRLAEANENLTVQTRLKGFP